MSLLLKLLFKLAGGDLSQTNKALILNFLLKKVDALPIADIITFNLQGTIQVNGKPLTVDEAVRLKQGAVSLQSNAFYRLIKEQIAFEAVKMGVHSSLTLDMVVFAKAALWIQQQELKLISEIGGDEVV